MLFANFIRDQSSGSIVVETPTTTVGKITVEGTLYTQHEGQIPVQGYIEIEAVYKEDVLELHGITDLKITATNGWFDIEPGTIVLDAEHDELACGQNEFVPTLCAFLKDFHLLEEEKKPKGFFKEFRKIETPFDVLNAKKKLDMAEDYATWCKEQAAIFKGYRAIYSFHSNKEPVKFEERRDGEFDTIPGPFMHDTEYEYTSWESQGWRDSEREVFDANKKCHSSFVTWDNNKKSHKSTLAWCEQNRKRKREEEARQEKMRKKRDARSGLGDGLVDADGNERKHPNMYKVLAGEWEGYTGKHTGTDCDEPENVLVKLQEGYYKDKVVSIATNDLDWLDEAKSDDE